jgi:uncharacterized membrane protein YcgQ (UPF0703/DUF1980 family)
MKRFLATLLTLALCLTGAASLAEGADIPVDVDVREKMFLTQMTELYVNIPDYLGKTIALEGMFDIFTDQTTGDVYHTVYRKSPGCCGNDGYTGLEVVWPDESKTYPLLNDWVHAVGVLEQYEENGVPYLRLQLISLEVKAERGLEFVTQ